MDPKEHKREIIERYTTRFEIGRKEEHRSGRKLSRDAWQGDRTGMKRKDIAPGGSVGECVVPGRSTDEDRLAKRCDIEDRVSSGYTNNISSSSSPRGLGDEVRSPWMF